MCKLNARSCNRHAVLCVLAHGMAVMCLILLGWSGYGWFGDPGPVHPQLQLDNYRTVDWRNASPDTLERLVEGWGQYGPEYDEAVVECLLSREFAATCMYVSWKPFDAFLRRLHEDDSLLRQLAWYRRWQAGQSLRAFGMLDREGIVAPPFASKSHPVVKDVCALSAPLAEDQMLSAMILLASEFNRPDVLDTLTPNTLPQRWLHFLDWLRDNALYFVSSEEDASYVIDKEAEKNNTAVAMARQRRPYPVVPLPACGDE